MITAEIRSSDKDTVDKGYYWYTVEKSSHYLWIGTSIDIFGPPAVNCPLTNIELWLYEHKYLIWSSLFENSLISVELR